MADKKEHAEREKTARAKHILANWDMPQEWPAAHIANSVWSVGTDYILKSGKREWILRNIQLTKALAKQGVSVGEIIPAKSGADYVEADGESLWVLHRAVRGEPLPVPERFGDRRIEFAFKFGAAIARLHKALASIGDDVDVEDMDLFRHVAEWALPKANADADFSSGFISALSELCPLLPKQLIHRDTHPENILWNDGDVSGFIDFDIAQRNVRLWDACYCATALLSDCRREDRESWFEILRGILSGYDSVAALTSAERQAVYYIVCAIQIVFIAWGAGQDEHREMAETSREMLDFIIRNRERIGALI
jgi:Ser/Thr protein kinase RdoA (MazF antagonist)